MIKQTEGHYEVERVPYGKDFNWRPDCVVVQCDCGERLDLTASETVCECGADHATLVREELESRNNTREDPRLEDEHRRWSENKDEYLRSEENHWQELKTLE